MSHDSTPDLRVSGRIGVIYVVAFSTGVVKLGRSAEPARRLAEHRHDAVALGLAVTDEWASPRHAGCDHTERALRSYAVKAGAVATVAGPRGEYLTGISFAQLIRRAKRLPYPTPPPPVRSERAPLVRERLSSEWTRIEALSPTERDAAWVWIGEEMIRRGLLAPPEPLARS